MTFQATAREADGVTVIDLRGRITFHEGSALRQMVHELLKKGKKRLVLNLAEVTYLDSSGIGELVSCYVATRREGGDLKTLQISKNLRELLRLTQLCAVLEDYSDEQAAIRSFFQQSPEC